MQVVALTADWADRVGALADAHYPESYRLSVEDIEENLEGLEMDEGNFCYGLVDPRRKLLGYLMAWVDNSLVEGRAEDVVLVDDVVLDRPAKGYLFSLLKRMIQQMSEAGFSHLAIEGTLRKNAESTFLKHPQAIERLGYELVASHEYEDTSLGESLVWVRFERVPEDQVEIDQTDKVDLA